MNNNQETISYQAFPKSGTYHSRRSISPSSIWYHLSWIGWTTTAVMYMIEPAMSGISFVAAGSLVLSMLMIVQTPLLALYLLPLPMMIGPIFVFRVAGIVFVTAGDIYSVILIVRTLLLRGVSISNSGKMFLLFSASLLVLGAAFSQDLSASLVGLTKILQYALLIRVSIALVRQPSDCRNLFTAWVFITTLCTIMMLWRFYIGRQFMINWSADTTVAYDIDLGRFDFLYRPTFFYVNIYIPIGLSILYSLMCFLIEAEPSGLKRMLLFFTIPVNLFVCIINNTRAMMLPVVVIGSLIILWFCFKSLTRPKLKAQELLISLSITGISIWYFAEFISTSQWYALMERAKSVESFIMRWSVWTSAVAKMFDNPIRLLVGWGAQSTTRQYRESHIQDLLTGSIGNTEGAFDSTIIALLVEYGIILSVFVFVYIARRFSRAWSYYRSTGDKFTSVLLVMLIAMLFSCIFQQFDLGPPSLMALQLLALLPALKRTPQRVLYYQCAESAED